MINIVVVEHIDSLREIILAALKSEFGINITGHFDNANDAITFIRKSKPDIILMDMELSKPNGLEATRIIMETNPVPIIIMSSRETKNTFPTLEAGAVAVVERPVVKSNKNSAKVLEKLVKTVRLMSEIKVVKRFPKNSFSNHNNNFEVGNLDIKNKIKVIVIGASTGGPIVLEKILTNLPHDFSIPIVIVQHIASGFTEGMVRWLNSKSVISVNIAENNMKLLPHNCYIAPEGVHLKLGKNQILFHSDEDPVNNLKPSVSVLFKSAAEVLGKNAMGILLTGMGKDGAEELKMIKNKGGITIAQDQQSSLIFGMPGEAIQIGAANHIFAPHEIIRFLKQIPY
ncbi:chemotaxis protein CheB [Bacteroidota bacterium]